MNRLFFRPDQCGMTKTDAAAQVGASRQRKTISSNAGA